MASKRGKGLGDRQGTRVGKPAPGRAGEMPFNADATDDKADRAKRAPNAGRTTEHERSSTGAGAEAFEGVQSAGGGNERTHRSGYGGAGGKPVRSSDQRQRGK